MWDTFFCPISIKIENLTASKVNKKEKPFNLNHGEPSEVKSFAFFIKNQLLIYVQQGKELS